MSLHVMPRNTAGVQSNMVAKAEHKQEIDNSVFLNGITFFNAPQAHPGACSHG
jgi:hypothetical protein